MSHEKERLDLLLFGLSFWLCFAAAEKHGNVTVSAQQFNAIVSVEGPFQLSYSISVEGGSQEGRINIYLVDQTNYNKIASGSFDSFNYLVEGSRLDVAAANVTDINIEDSGTFYVVLLNKNLLFSVTVNYSVSAEHSVGEVLGAGLIALIVILSVCCCIFIIVGCLTICIFIRRRQAKKAREAVKQDLFG